MSVRRAERAPADGYDCALLPGLRASADARRLAQELAFSGERLAQLSADPPGLWGEAARDPDRERGAALVFLIVYLCPLEDADDPWAGISAAREEWLQGGLPDLANVPLGPRSHHDRSHGPRTLGAYRAWWQRSGSQAAAFTGDPAWDPVRRFERDFERLALPGLPRAGRYELLVAVGRLGLAPVKAGGLRLGEDDAVALAAKRIFAIGDLRLLERRAAALAQACGLPIEALDLALDNWQRGTRSTLGAVGPGSAQDAGRRIAAALSL